jgi:hypothetical protein
MPRFYPECTEARDKKNTKASTVAVIRGGRLLDAARRRADTADILIRAHDPAPSGRPG